MFPSSKFKQYRYFFTDDDFSNTIIGIPTLIAFPSYVSMLCFQTMFPK